jgi:hypothetical protein
MRIHHLSLEKLDGWTRLHHLELAAHDALIDDDHFQDVLIPKKAAELSFRFSRALQPLFTHTQAQNQSSVFESWGENEDVRDDRRVRLTEIFELALRLKASTVASDHVYEFVVFPPGISPAVEEVKGPDKTTNNQQRSLNERNTDHENSPTQYWLLASIHSYLADASIPRKPMTDALVQPKNFVQKTEQERRELTLHTKTIVVPKIESANGSHDRGSPFSIESSVELDDDLYSEACEDHASQALSAEIMSLGSTRQLLPYKCEDCGRSFARSFNYRVHKQNSWSTRPPNPLQALKL